MCSEAEAAPAEPAATTPAVIVTADPKGKWLDLDDEEYCVTPWIDLVAHDDHEREKALLARLERIREDMQGPIESARKTDNPKYMAADLRAIKRGLTSMFQVLKAVDKHRREVHQEIIVLRDDEPVPLEAEENHDPRTTKADSLLNEYVADTIGILDLFAEQCRREVNFLASMTQQELSGRVDGRRVHVDRRTWETKFSTMVLELQGRAAVYQQLMERRHKRGRQVIRVRNGRSKSLQGAPARTTHNPGLPTQSADACTSSAEL